MMHDRNKLGAVAPYLSFAAARRVRHHAALRRKTWRLRRMCECDSC